MKKYIYFSLILILFALILSNIVKSGDKDYFYYDNGRFSLLFEEHPLTAKLIQDSLLKLDNIITKDEAIIQVSDIDYGDVCIGTTVIKSFDIRNSGSAPLYIYGFKGPKNSEFKVDTKLIDDLKYKDSITILPNSSNYTLNVSYTPDEANNYKDSIVFFSNAASIDSVCILRGGNVSSLTANDMYWGEKPISTLEFPAGPYSPDTNGRYGITLRNNGTNAIQITGFTIIYGDINDPTFIFDRTMFINLTIFPGDSFFIPVSFHPESVGLHTLIFSYINSSGCYVQTILNGYGTQPTDVSSDSKYYSNKIIMGIIPNPVIRNQASLNLLIPMETSVEIIIYNSFGEITNSFITNILPAGGNNITLPVSELSSGVYYIIIKCGKIIESKRFLIIR